MLLSSCSITLISYDYDLLFLQSLCRDDASPSSDSSDSERPFPGADEGTVEYIRQFLRNKDEARQNYSQKTIRSQRLATELEVAESDRAVVRAQLTAADSRVACKFLFMQCTSYFVDSVLDSLSSVLESQIQALHAAAATAPNTVNAHGDTVAARLQDIPRRVREVAGHGVRWGASVALATAQYQSGHDIL